MTFPQFPDIDKDSHAVEYKKLKEAYQRSCSLKRNHVNLLIKRIHEQCKTKREIIDLSKSPHLHTSDDLASLYKSALDFRKISTPRTGHLISNLASDDERENHEDHKHIKIFIKELIQYLSEINKAAIDEIKKELN